MRAVETLLAANPALPSRSTVVRVHANVLGEEAEQGQPGEKLLRAAARARAPAARPGGAPGTPARAGHATASCSWTRWTRSAAQVGGQPNVTGIRAQEALLTLIENEAVPFTPPRVGGRGRRQPRFERSPVRVRGGLRGPLRRGLQPRDGRAGTRARLKPVTVMEGSRVREELQFALRDWLKNEDLFEYGVSPQFLSRFDAVVLLEQPGRGRAPAHLAREPPTPACASRRPTSPARGSSSRSRRPPRAASRRRPRASRGSAPAP